MGLEGPQCLEFWSQFKKQRVCSGRMVLYALRVRNVSPMKGGLACYL